MSLKLFKSLLFKSLRVESEIQKEYKKPWKDHLRLVRLKKMRLQIKDQIKRLVRGSVRRFDSRSGNSGLLSS